MRRLLPTPLDVVDVRQEYVVAPGATWLRANMVTTVDGAATDSDGLSGGISGAADRAVFHVLRSLADAILVGARTAQAERYRRAAVPVVLLSRTLDLDLTTPLLAAPPEPGTAATLVFAPQSAPAARRAALTAHAEEVGGIELLTAGSEDLDLARALAELRHRGLAHLLCEGGPSVLAALVAGELVDELCLTTSPVVVGGSAARIVAGAPIRSGAPWRLRGLCEDEGFLFARWQRPGSALF